MACTGYKDDALVSARPDGSLVNPRTFGNRVIELAIRAKVTPITAHCLRDTHASLLAKKGVPLEVLSKHKGEPADGEGEAFGFTGVYGGWIRIRCTLRRISEGEG